MTQDTTTVRKDDTYRALSTYYYNASLLPAGVWEGVNSGGTYMGGPATFVATQNWKNGNDGSAPDTVTKYRCRRDGTIVRDRR